MEFSATWEICPGLNAVLKIMESIFFATFVEHDSQENLVRHLFAKIKLSVVQSLFLQLVLTKNRQLFKCNN